MKTQIDEFIEREEEIREECRKGYSFIDGAHLLAPLLVEAMEALEFLAAPGKVNIDRCYVAPKTLQSIKQKLGQTMANLEPKWRDKYYDEAAECEALKKQKQEFEVDPDSEGNIIIEMEKEITDIRKHCEAMASSLRVIREVVDGSAPVVNLKHGLVNVCDKSLKAYEKFKEG